MSGSDKATWSLSGALLTVTKKDKTAYNKAAVVTVAEDKTASTSGKTKVKAKCEGMGFGWVRVAPAGDKTVVSADTKTAMDTLMAADKAKKAP